MKPVPSQPYTDLPDLSDEERIARAQAFYDSVRDRRSCRFFADTPVPRAVIETAIRAAGTAPNGANHQPWHFAVVESPALKRRIRAAAEEEERAFYDGKAGEEWLDALAPIGTDADKPFLETAPFLIVAFAQRKSKEGAQNYYVTESVSLSCSLLITTLHHAGLATLTHTPSPMGFLREICERPKTEKPLMIIVAGLPAEGATVPSHAATKKSLDDIASWL